MAKLVIFYSRAGENYFRGKVQDVEVGNTEKVAHMIADATGAELFKIEQKVPYSPNYQLSTDQALADKQANVRPELAKLPDSLDIYDEIYLGYPNYWGDLPMAVYTFLEAFDWKGKVIHPFCTHEGSGMGGTKRTIACTCKGAHVTEGLAIQGSDVGASCEKVLAWLAAEKGKKEERFPSVSPSIPK